MTRNDVRLRHVERGTKSNSYITSDATPGFSTSSFGYDSAFNPTTFKGTSQSFNSNNQNTASGYAYDGNGNAMSYGGLSNTFDLYDRLSTTTSPWYGIWRWRLGYSYGADGLLGMRAVEIDILDEETGTWETGLYPPTYYLHDQGEPVVELDSEGAVSAINVRGPDGLVARKESGTWTYYTFDQQGNVVQKLNSSGSITATRTYDAYGAETGTGSSGTDPFGFNAQWGYYLDRATGMYLCQNRWYDPSQGRWLNRDPIGYSGGVNLYGYCGQNGNGGADPIGLFRGAPLLEAPLEAGEAGEIVAMGSRAPAVLSRLGPIGLAIAGGIALGWELSERFPIQTSQGNIDRGIREMADQTPLSVRSLPSLRNGGTDSSDCSSSDSSHEVLNGTRGSFEFNVYQGRIKSADWQLEGILTEDDCWEWAARMESMIGRGWSRYHYRLLMDTIGEKRDQCVAWVRLNKNPFNL